MVGKRGKDAMSMLCDICNKRGETLCVYLYVVNDAYSAYDDAGSKLLGGKFSMKSDRTIPFRCHHSRDVLEDLIHDAIKLVSLSYFGYILSRFPQTTTYKIPLSLGSIQTGDF